MSHLRTTPFPHLTIRRVTIDHSEISIDAFLTVHANNSENNWLTEELFADYVKIYFFIVKNSFAEVDDTRLASYLANPMTRVDNILEYYPRSSNPPPPEYWFSEVARESIYKAITFSEAMTSFYESNVVTSELDRNSGSLKDINFNVKIDEGFNLANILAHPSTPGLRLYALTHLDVSGMISDFSLNEDPNSIANMLQLGGNLTVEDMLIRNEETTVFDIPDTHDILTYDDGTPYSGVYHIHTIDRPGPDGYVGYMEGSREDEQMSQARRLYVKSVPHRKIIANFILEEASLDNPFNGSAELQQALDYNYLTPHTETRDIFSQLYSDTNLFASDLPNFPGGPTRTSTSAINTMKDTNLANIYNNDSIKNLRKKHFDLLNERRDFSIFKDSYNYISYLEEEDINHRTSFKLDFEKLVRSKSKYAFLIDNLVKAATGPNAPDSESRVELYNILNLVKINKFKVKRFRLSNSPRSNNPVCTNDFDKFSKEQLETHMVTTSENVSSNIVDSVIVRDASGERDFAIQETPRVDAFNIREFTFKDYNLAKKINYGNYAYKVEIHIEDRIKTRLFELAENLLTNQAKFLEFLSAAQGGTSTPSDPQDRINFERSYVRGNINYEKYYDHSAARYSEAFKALFEAEFRTSVNRFIRYFIDLQIILGSISVESKKPMRKTLIRLIHPQNGNYESAVFFSKIAENSIKSLLKILERDNISDTSTSNFDSSGNSFRKSISSSPQNAKSNVLSFEKRIPGSVRTFVEGDVFYSFGVSALEAQASRASSIRPDRPAGSSGIFAESIDSHGQDIGTYRIMDIDTYIQFPESERFVVDANIRQIETTLPSETINQADRDLNLPLPGLGDVLSGVSIEDPSSTMTNTNVLTGVGTESDLRSGLPGIDAGGILDAGNIPDVNIQAEIENINLVNHGLNETVNTVVTDLKNELSKEVLVLDSQVINLGTAGGSFAKTEGSVQIMTAGSSEAKFESLSPASLGKAETESNNGMVTIKVELPNNSTGTATNNVFTVSAQAASSYIGGVEAAAGSFENTAATAGTFTGTGYGGNTGFTSTAGNFGSYGGIF